MLRLVGPELLSPARLTAFVRQFGQAAPVAFMLFLAARPFTLLPGQLLTAVAGILFGSVWGTVYSLVGSFLACGVIFLLARRAGAKVLKRVAGQRFDTLTATARRHDFKLLLLGAMNPLVPTDVLVAAASSAGARFLPSALGLLLGIFPGTVATAVFGSALGQGKTILTTISALGMLGSCLLGVWLGRTILDEVRRPAPRPLLRASRLRAESA
jgi:uncharacterized membrane protein YdjX (TVP38/TMEM64 family)